MLLPREERSSSRSTSDGYYETGIRSSYSRRSSRHRRQAAAAAAAPAVTLAANVDAAPPSCLILALPPPLHGVAATADNAASIFVSAAA